MLPSDAATTIAAIATPMGRGGIGIIRLSGPESLRIAKALSIRDNIQARTAQLCSWKDEGGGIIDSGILIYFPNPTSYTGEDVVELQGHGSPVLLHALLHRCFHLGAVPAQAGEFTRRALEHGRMDLSQAEAVIACIDAETERAGKQAQRHLAGEFGSKIEQLMDALTGVVAHVEACLDFPEEEIPALFLEQLKTQLQQDILSPIQSMLASAAFGERLFSGVTIAIVAVILQAQHAMCWKSTLRFMAFPFVWWIQQVSEKRPTKLKLKVFVVPNKRQKWRMWSSFLLMPQMRAHGITKVIMI